MVGELYGFADFMYLAPVNMETIRCTPQTDKMVAQAFGRILFCINSHNPPFA